MIVLIDTEGVCAEWTFPAEPGVARRARDLTRERLTDWGLAAMTDVTILVVSELVTNSLRYAHGPIGLRLSRRRDSLFVEVSDPVTRGPRERRPRPDEEHGRGIRLLSRQSRNWGTNVDPARTGKTVWCELPIPVA
ncbi:ATP-binding protein [Streptomyces sp. NRRL F-5630]|uniref:ATP-binding protein n=1 Tax=unclassified Streptomyces TaxID=2593676 RepID=UPI0004C74754|nr:ATP-binding protein [Streptomyces sp. NRRL F-5630]